MRSETEAVEIVSLEIAVVSSLVVVKGEQKVLWRLSLSIGPSIGRSTS